MRSTNDRFFLFINNRPITLPEKTIKEMYTAVKDKFLEMRESEHLKKHIFFFLSIQAPKDCLDGSHLALQENTDDIVNLEPNKTKVFIHNLVELTEKYAFSPRP